MTTFRYLSIHNIVHSQYFYLYPFVNIATAAEMGLLYLQLNTFPVQCRTHYQLSRTYIKILSDGDREGGLTSKEANSFFCFFFLDDMRAYCSLLSFLFMLKQAQIMTYNYFTCSNPVSFGHVVKTVKVISYTGLKKPNPVAIKIWSAIFYFPREHILILSRIHLLHTQ